MAGTEACVSLLVMVTTMVVTAACQRVTRRSVGHKSQAHYFLLEFTGAFQICACSQELRLLADLPPKPQVALAFIYVSTALHGMTLPGSLNNPSSSCQLLYKGRIPVKTFWLHTSAHFTGAVLANVYAKLIWSLRILPAHSRALAGNCADPIQTTLANAFVLELCFSFLFHLTLLQLESLNRTTKVHLVALLMTTLAYGGGHLTGAIFNPALALSMHLSCFFDKVWDYILVYWIAPSLGSVLVVLMWDEIIPMLQRAR